VICQCEALEPLATGTNPVPLPEPEAVLADSSASDWLKNAIRTSITRDPVDAANDAEFLFRLLDRRVSQTLSRS
jgi:hypothetical protein